MSLSARRLGQEYGLTAEEMNVLLKEEGFLDGEPGGYYPTEKGRRFVYEKGDDNGYGGYAFRGWNWLEWDESIMNELHVTSERKREIREKTLEQRRRRRAEREAASEEYWRNVNNKNQQSASQQYDQDEESSPLGKIIVGGLALAGIGIYKIVKHFINKED